MASYKYQWLALLLAAPLVSAAPSLHVPNGHEITNTPYGTTALPRDATHLALDEQTREIVAFKRAELLGRFPIVPSAGVISQRDGGAGSCSALSSDDVQKLPGWNTLKSTAEKNWGTGSYNVVTNDKDYPSQSAQSCVSTDTVNIVLDGNPSSSSACRTQTSSSSGQLVGSSGSTVLAFQEGMKSTTTTTVTKESDISVGVGVTAKVGFPGVANVTSGFSFSASFTNTLSTASESSTDGTNKQTKTQNSTAGQTCHLEFTTQSCSITGTGKVRMLGTGWVWFEYNSQTDGHYKWALSIDSTLTNQDDRSSFIEFSSVTGTTDTSNYNGVCS